MSLSQPNLAKKGAKKSNRLVLREAVTFFTAFYSKRKPAPFGAGLCLILLFYLLLTIIVAVASS